MTRKLLVLWLIVGTIWVAAVVAAHGQSPSTVLAEGTPVSGWHAAETIPAQCGPSGCGIGIGIQRWQYRPSPMQMPGIRSQTEAYQLPDLMCAVEGGMGVHVGDGLVVTCNHGSKATIDYRGSRYHATLVLADAEADVAILRASCRFERRIGLSRSRPPSGSTVYWQGGAGKILSYDANTMWLACRFRLGDSGGPVWVADGLVGVVSAVRSDGTNESIAGNWDAIVKLVSAARTQLGLAPLPELEPQQSSPAPAAGIPSPVSQNLPGGDAATGPAADYVAKLDEIRSEIAAWRQQQGQAIAKAEANVSVQIQAAEKRLVPIEWADKMDGRVGQLELDRDALKLAVEAIRPAKGEPGAPGPIGPAGPPGAMPKINLALLAGEVAPLVVERLRIPQESKPGGPAYFEIVPRRGE